ncbi:gamma-aminobutyric acid type B receptor subunit 2-like [Ylistrum balloti]|uniref:gamma-aminobutyric acid type B receptor subunit 2-like n=1 Tax=Ylistrum balloti TaxID=509963 RepID=UPI002905DE18|nr:gamma-aminobutyric acid type B receptor subunit 2-like [Ylistrum balloti]
MQDGLWDGSGILPAAEMALEDVNNDDTILKEYDLRMAWNNSKCDTGIAVQSLFHQLYAEPQKVAIFGPGCSSATKPIAQVAPYWNLVQVTHAANSPDLNNRELYPLLFGAFPTESVTNQPKIAVMKAFGWKRAAFLYSTDGSFSTIMTDLQALFISNDFEIITSETFHSDATVALQNIKAYRLGMTGTSYTWFLPGWFTRQWWNVTFTDCNTEELKSSIGGHLAFQVVSIADPETPTDIGKNPREFATEFAARTSSGEYGGKEYAPSGYDGIWMIAHALNKTLDIMAERGEGWEDFTYSRDDMKNLLFNALGSVSFAGISGNIQFDGNGLRLGLTKILQFIDGDYIHLSTFDLTVGTLQNQSVAYKWKTRNGLPPLDGPRVLRELRDVSEFLSYSVMTLAACGVIFTCFLLGVNVKFRHRKIMKMSSPKVNYLICSGSIVLYTSSLLHGVEVIENRAEGSLAVVCILKSWFLSIGFTASYGALIAKAWRIHKIITYAKYKKQNIKDWLLFLIIAILLLFDAIILITWLIVDPLRYQLVNGTKEDYGQDVYVSPFTFKCSSESYLWVAVLFSYNGLLMLYGAVIAWNTRKISMTLLNDAKSIAMTIYTSTVLSIFGVPVSVLVKSDLNLNYGISEFCIVFATTILLVFCFVPKVRLVLTTSVSDDNTILANYVINVPSSNEVSSLHTTMTLQRQLEECKKTIEIQRKQLNTRQKDDRF